MVSLSSRRALLTYGAAFYCTVAFPCECFCVQELFLEALAKEIRTASASSRVYPSAETINTLLIGAAAKVMQVSEDVAVEKLQDKMMLPVRKPAKGMALVVSYQYIKRVFWHLNGSLSSIAVSTFVKRTHALKNIGSWSTPSASSTRRVLEQSPEECMQLLNADSFVKDAHGRLAMLDVLANVLDELEATGSMVSWMGPNNAIRVIRCLFGHVANVSFRVRYWTPLFCYSGLAALLDLVRSCHTVFGVYIWVQFRTHC